MIGNVFVYLHLCICIRVIVFVYLYLCIFIFVFVLVYLYLCSCVNVFLSLFSVCVDNSVVLSLSHRYCLTCLRCRLQHARQQPLFKTLFQTLCLALFSSVWSFSVYSGQ